MAEQKFVGVSPWGNRFRAQVTVGGRTFYLGTEDNAVNAARLFDNAAFYLSKHGQRVRKLNFPADYEFGNPPAPFSQTQAVLEKVLAKRNEVPAPADLLLRLLALREPLAAFLRALEALGQSTAILKSQP